MRGEGTPVSELLEHVVEHKFICRKMLSVGTGESGGGAPGILEIRLNLQQLNIIWLK